MPDLSGTPSVPLLPRSLASRSRTLRIGDVPVLVAHPDWKTPAPAALWLHGRTAHKELDPGRYLRWIRAGVAAVAIDLPGHGERRVRGMDTPERTLEVLERAVRDVDVVLEGLGGKDFAGLVDSTRLALGGMSLGGMTALRRLCEPHPFVCAAVEATTGWLQGLYFPESWGAPASFPRWPVRHERGVVERLDPSAHLGGFAPVPLLAIHSRADETVPFLAQEEFLARLAERYQQAGASAELIETVLFDRTGAPQEHVGFGLKSNDAKNAQTAFLAKHLRAVAPAQDGEGTP